MIVEGLVTTIDANGQLHVAPMGPRVIESGRRLLLRPFNTSNTYRNLKATRQGVFHITDDAELVARAAVGKVEVASRPASVVQGHVLTGACRALEFRVTRLDESSERVTLEVDVVHEQRLRDFVGFNRARHAVLEAAILATRVHLLNIDEILTRLAGLAVLVEKTGEEPEKRALEFLEGYVRGQRAARPPAGTHEVRVRTGSRLHLGLLVPAARSDEALGVRQFGGAGLMVERPGLEITLRRAATPKAEGPFGPRLLEAARRFLGGREPAFEIELTAAPEHHRGLGTGTQLALAVACGVAALEAVPFAPEECASRLGRGRRSAVGLHGFAYGGFVAEGGVTTADGQSGEGVAPMLFQRAVPAAWRFVLISPPAPPGLAGADEQLAFRDLPPPSEESVDRLCGLLWRGLLPTLAEEDFDGFSEVLHEYGRLAGEFFSTVQGGPFAGSGVERVVHYLRREGVSGVGQSSWGPTVYAVARDEDEAQRIAAQVREELHLEDNAVLVTAPRNEGAELTWPGRPSRETLVG